MGRCRQRAGRRVTEIHRLATTGGLIVVFSTRIGFQHLQSGLRVGWNYEYAFHLHQLHCLQMKDVGNLARPAKRWPKFQLSCCGSHIQQECAGDPTTSFVVGRPVTVLASAPWRDISTRFPHGRTHRSGVPQRRDDDSRRTSREGPLVDHVANRAGREQAVLPFLWSRPTRRPSLR